MKILEFIKKYYSIILFGIILVLSVFLFQTCSNLKKEREDRVFQEKIRTQNISAMTDSIRVEFNEKLKAYEFSKDNYVLEQLKDLENYNKVLYDKLKKVQGDIIAAINSKVQGDLGGIKTSNELITIDSTKFQYGLKFKSFYQDKGFEQKLVGSSRFYLLPNEITKKWTIQPDITIIDTNLTTIKITYGLKDLDDKYRVFAISESPKIKLIELDGGFFYKKAPQPLIDKSKNWAIGPYIGFGLNTDYNLANPRFGWSMGFSIHYDILQWRFGKKK